MRMMKVRETEGHTRWFNPFHVGEIAPGNPVSITVLEYDVDITSCDTFKDVLAEWHAAMNEEPECEEVQPVDSDEQELDLGEGTVATWTGSRIHQLRISDDTGDFVVLTREEARKLYQFLSRFVGDEEPKQPEPRKG